MTASNELYQKTRNTAPPAPPGRVFLATFDGLFAALSSSNGEHFANHECAACIGDRSDTQDRERQFYPQGHRLAICAKFHSSP